MAPFFLWFYASLAGITGLCIGSFINVVTYRYPIILKQKFANNQENNTSSKISLSYPSSHCPLCKNKIKKRDNIPVFSWFLLKGKCRHCSANININYMITEAFFGLIFLASYLFLVPKCGVLLTTCFLILFCYLYCIFIIDLRNYLIPDIFSYSLIWIGLAISALKISPISPSEAIGGVITIWIIIYLTGLAFEFIRGIEGIGFGDYKLLSVGGAWTGIYNCASLLILSSILGLFFIFLNRFLYLAKEPPSELFSDLGDRKNDIIPFGPAICSAICAIFLYIILN